MRRLLLLLLVGTGCASGAATRPAAETQEPRVAKAGFREAVRLIVEARAAMSTEKWGDALELADRALEAAPQMIEAHRIRGEALMQLDRFDESVAAFDRFLAGDPDDVIARYLRAFALLRGGRQGEADAAIASLLADLPEDHELRPTLLCTRAIHAAREGREDDSITFRMHACAQDADSCCP